MNELAGEDYLENKRKEKEDSLNELIDGAVSDCVLAVLELLTAFYNEKNPSWQRAAEIYKEATERIKKILN